MEMATHDDDLELLAAWQHGDASAGQVLVRRHLESVYRFFYGKVDADVADLVQRTFLACAEKRSQLAPTGAFRPYLLGVARNQLLMALRRAPRRVFEPLRAEPIAGTSASPDRRAVGREQRRYLFAALRSLPWDVQLLIELYYWEELRVDEIATVMSVRPGTIKARLHHARKALEREMARVTADPWLAESTLSDLSQWATAFRDAHRRQDSPP